MQLTETHRNAWGQTAAEAAKGIGSPVLGPHDVVGSTFYIACNMMLAGAAFFFVERFTVPKQWGTPVLSAGIVCFVAWYNYQFMRDVWQRTQQGPTVYRYADWLITVPIQIVEFFFILKTAGPVPNSLGVKLMVAAIAMLAFGWTAETDILDKASGFIFGCAAWLYIIYEVFAGEAASLSKSIGNPASQKAFNTLKWIVSVGWSIYPLGYALGYIIHTGSWATNSYMELCWVNCVYNIADLVNKLAFGIAIWSAAKSDVVRDVEKPLLTA